MPKIDLINDDLMNSPEVRMKLDMFAFEDYCGACDHFNTEECPFYGKVHDETEWRLIGCKNFWD